MFSQFTDIKRKVSVRELLGYSVLYYVSFLTAATFILCV